MAKHLNSVVGLKTFTTRSIPGGVRITGTYTQAKAVWTVTAGGKKAVARRG
jgi:hypothetical protein